MISVADQANRSLPLGRMTQCLAVEPPHVASQNLEIHMRHLVDECITAAVANPEAFRTEGTPIGPGIRTRPPGCRGP